MNVTICSRRSARNNSRFCSIQFVVRNPGPAAVSISLPMRSAWYISSTLKEISDTRSGSPNRACASFRQKPIARVVLIKPGPKNPHNAKALIFRHNPQRSQFTLRTRNHDRRPHLRIQRVRQIVANHQRRFRAIRIRSRAVSASASGCAVPIVTFASRSLTVRSCAGTIPFTRAPPERAPREISTCP